MYRFNVDEGTWGQGCSMPVARARHASVAVRDGHVFLFGGVTMAPPNGGTIGNVPRLRSGEVRVDLSCVFMLIRMIIKEYFLETNLEL